jgi:hypothetical protein
MGKPLNSYLLPDKKSQGWFGANRKYDIHTGIDLYCNQFDNVYAIEDGIVVNVCNFTGPKAGLDWWNDTDAVLIEGKSGVILYGEIDPIVKIGDHILEGDLIGKILRVLKTDKGLPMDMLHLELYEVGYRGNGEIWNLQEAKPTLLKDPSMLVLSYIYDIKLGVYDYKIKIDKNEDGFCYSITAFDSMQIDGDFFEDYYEAIQNAVMVICDGDEKAYKVLMRDINLNDILE